MSQTETETVQTSIAEVWYLKEIKFNGMKYRIITQNFNGPCSFIAICNILILRGDIEVLPHTRRTVSYEFLAQLVADYLLNTSPDVDVSAALSVMPLTQKGMDLNPVFTSSNTFHPSGFGGELKLFHHVGIPLIHGWLVDPDSPEAEVFSRVNDYDAAVGLIAEVDHLTNGKFVVSEDEMFPVSKAGSSSEAGAASCQRYWTEEELLKVQDAIVVRRFLDSTQSQLTYHGLFHLATALPSDSLCALFRNSHLSVLYKHAPRLSSQLPQAIPDLPPAEAAEPLDNEVASSTSPVDPSSTVESVIEKVTEHEGDPALYSLVTDQVFLQEPSVVWEMLEDVDGGWSTFVDSDFVRSSPAGGDFAGQTAEEALRFAEAETDAQTGNDANDFALARQLQAEEEYFARRDHEAYLREEERRRLALAQQQHQPRKTKKKKGDCIVM